ncbi:uncharacterized protein A1O9_05350 [Exophiala aquamarina CBS 119918]|uniref:Uncharacterized protein n=1 Tax=Exophiala aquamarina CBS 119918 TaxID=1182545 RepID=A0A072PDR5_9EURO|nr:uncharacterized protein A1O9_05350 [Exophiala aquamarina CBS 119918]KEF57433.1 hypothetical protein A1O9_05350 [Exophiala aquamarina CBS 119918]
MFDSTFVSQELVRYRTRSSPHGFFYHVSIAGQMATPSLSTVTVVAYDPAWPLLFEGISEKLKQYLEKCAVTYELLEHVGSTAVPGLPAKPNIDIIITVPDAENADKAKEALIHEPSPEGHYKCYGDGGIRGRISLKPHVRHPLQDQSIYIIREDDPDGQLVVRCHLSLRDTLRLPEHEALKEEYGQVKLQLAHSALDGVDYGQRKNPIIRKILRTAGWSDAEISLKEALDYRIAGEWDEPPY